MRGTVNRRGRATTEVTVTGVARTIADKVVLDVALAAANENRSSIWGWTMARVEADPTTAIVKLHTD